MSATRTSFGEYQRIELAGQRGCRFGRDVSNDRVRPDEHMEVGNHPALWREVQRVRAGARTQGFDFIGQQRLQEGQAIGALKAQAATRGHSQSIRRRP
jgi:hypothetical protein